MWKALAAAWHYLRSRSSFYCVTITLHSSIWLSAQYTGTSTWVDELASSHPCSTSSQAGLSPILHPGPGIAPTIPLASRPSVNTPPHSPHSPGLPVPPKCRPSPAPMESPYPQLMPMPQMPSGAQYQGNDSAGGLNLYISPAVQVTMPQPGNPWYPQPNTQPAWQYQYWNNPNEMAPVHAPPPPGQHLGVYTSEGGYSNLFSFPEVMRPSADYHDGYSMSQTPPLLEPQQLNLGPPSPLSPSRESPAPTLLQWGEYHVFIERTTPFACVCFCDIVPSN
jgi:hypothetical protein